MEMTLTDQIDEILFRAFRWMTVPEIVGAMRAMFASCPTPHAIENALNAEPSFVRYGNRYCVNLMKRADRLVAKFGLLTE